jgi:transposase-like protein
MNEINLPNLDYSAEVKKCKTMDDVLGKDGLLQRLLKDVIQNMLDAEMSEHLGRDKYERVPGESPDNYRNGYSEKTLKSSIGEMTIDVPRDRNGEFEPVVVKKYETVCNELDNKVISMYAKGMTTRDIQAALQDIYGIDISPSMISKITDKIMGSASDWQNRLLDKVYPIMFMDAIHYKVRSENRIISKAAYICMAFGIDGHKDILGIWIGEQEGAKFWLSVCNDLRNRGVEDILIACMDGLKGLPEAIKTVFPDVVIQNCIIHQIRNSLKYVVWKDQKEFMEDLKKVYKAVSEEVAMQELENLNVKWGKKYSVVINSWYNNWANLATYFSYPPEIRRIIYTTNALEGFNRQLRKVTKTKTIFPNDEALRKSLFLATMDIIKKWTSPVQNWGSTLAQLSIIFEGRIDF